MVYQGESATFWMEHEVLFAIANAKPRSLEKQKTDYDLIRKITNNKRVCVLIDTTLAVAQDKVTRTYSEKELPNLFKAMAFVSASSFGRFITYVFLKLKKQPIPIGIFSTEKEAREWLKKIDD